jgi:hypothetical protein
VNKAGEIIVSQLVAGIVTAAVLPAVFIAVKAAYVMGNAILGDDDSVLARAALEYTLFSAVFGALLAVLATARFSESSRRICAVWGAVAGIVVLSLGAGAVLYLSSLSFGTGMSLTERQSLAGDARHWLTAIAFVTYLAGLTWGLKSSAGSSRGRRRLFPLAIVAAIAAMPGVFAAAWFLWRG